MQSLPQLLWLRCLKSIIDFSPLMVEPETPALDAIALMAKEGVDVLVMSASQVLGCLSPQDVVRLVASGVNLKTTKISEVMNTSIEVLKLSKLQNMATVLSLLQHDQSNCLPVVDEQGKLIGIVTSDSVCHALEQPVEKVLDEYLQTPEERLRLLESVVVNINDAIVITEASLLDEPFGPHIIYVNAAFTNMTGYTADEVIGKTPRILQGENTSRTELNRIRAALQAGLPVRTELINYHKNASTYWVEINVVPISDPEGKITHFVSVQRHISERKQAFAALEDSTARLKLALEASNTIYWEHNLENDQIFLLNTVHQPQENQGLSYTESLALLHPDDLEKVHRATQLAIANLSSFEIEHRILVEPGSHDYKWWLARAKVLGDTTGKPTRIIGVSVDITDRVLARQALQKVNQELEMGVAKRTIALQQINRRLLSEIAQREISQNQLQQSQQMLRLIMDNIPQFICWKDLNSVYLGCNRNFVQIASCESPEDIIGKTDYDLVPKKEQAEFYRECDARVMQTNTPEYHIIELFDQVDGQQSWLETNKVPLHDVEGNVVGILCTIEDITQRQQPQEALKKSEERFRFLAESIPQQVWITQPNGYADYVNQRTVNYFNCPIEEILGWQWQQFLHPSDRSPTLAAWNQSLATGEAYEVEFRLRCGASGTYRWHLARALPLRDQAGNIVNWFGTNTDIDDVYDELRLRKRAEEALAERVRLADFRADIDAVLTQTETLNNMMQSCTEAIVQHLDAAFARIWMINKEENVLELQVSSGMYTHVDGLHKRVPVGQYKIGLIAQEGKPHLTNSVQNDPHVSNQEWAKQQGMIAFAGYPLIVDGEVLGVIAMFACQALTDSTLKSLEFAAGEIAIGIKRKQAELALQHSEERFRNLVETSSDLVWEVDENAIYTYVSPKVQDILGYEPQELLGKTPFELMPPEEAERVRNVFAPIAAAQQPLKCLENINIHRDGHLVVLETSGVPIFDVEGNFRGYRGMDRDITTRNHSETILRKTQQQLQAILDNSPAVIYVVDMQDRFLLINRQYERLFKITQEQVVGKNSYDIFPHDIAEKLAANNLQVIANGIPVEVEEVVPQGDGLHTYLSVKFLLKDADNVPYALCGISTDITDRKRTQADLNQSEERFRLLVEGVQDYAIYLLDSKGLVMSWNSGAESMTGYQAVEVIGEDFSCFFPPEDIHRDIPSQQLKMATVNGRCESESILIRKDGSPFWANLILTPLRDETGKLRGFSKITRDITERKLAEECLLRFYKAMESTSDAIAIGDLMGEIIYLNPAFVELYGYTLEELEADGGSIVIFQYAQEYHQIFTAVYSGNSWRGELSMRSRSGNTLQIYLRVDAIKDPTGKILGIVCIHSDITGRKQVEEGLRLRDRAIAASSNGIVIADASIPNRPIIYVNPAFERMTGYSADEVIGSNFRSFYSNDLHQSGLEELSTAMREGKACIVTLCQYRKDSRPLWNELNVSPVFDATGILTHYIGIQTDITERKQSETALLVSQQRLQYLLVSSPAVIYTCKTSGDFGAIFISDNIATMTGYETWEFLEDCRFWAKCIHPEDAPNVFTKLAQVLDQEKYNLEYRFLHKDGTYRWFYDKGKLVRDDTGNPVELVGCLADITDRKQLEEELKVALEKEKELNELKSRFVSMTSHEFRTPLSTILSSSELLEYYRHKWTEEKQLIHLHRIQTAVNRMTEMLNDVLVIGKAEAGKLEFMPKPLDLVEYCCHLVQEIQMNVSNHQVINFTSSCPSLPCYMDDKLLEHILSNLISNAIKYSPDKNAINFTLNCQDEKAIFEIQDSGIGVPSEDLPRLFESFHRARNVGNILGTGLGLAIVKKCVDIHEGEIFVTSQIGVGTKFTVKIPLNNYMKNE